MRARSLYLGLAWGVLVLGVVLGGCTGDAGPAGPQGPPGETGGILTAPFHRADLDLAAESCTVCHAGDTVADIAEMHGLPPEVVLPIALTTVDASKNPELLENVEVESEILNVSIASPPVVTFSVFTTNGIGITGIGNLWDDDDHYVRFTFAKLVPGTNGDPNNWVSYTRDATSGEPDYDSGASLVDNGDGTYVFTFATDVANVTGVPYEPNLTHRLAGQIGSRDVPLQPQNLVLDFVPNGGGLPNTRYIAVMDSCNECHDNLVFHGRRFLVEYCVTCHNPDLEGGEGNMPFMIHRIHAAGDFATLDGGRSYADVTYPQDLENCRKCHSAGIAPDVTLTPDGNNWMNVPNRVACDGCHGVLNAPDDFVTYHTAANPGTGNASCALCHPPSAIEDYHMTTNATPHNPFLQTGQRDITYEVVDASVGTGGTVTVVFRILSDGTPLDVTNLPQDLLIPGRYPGLLLAWAQPQDGIAMPADFNNLGRPSAQPISISLGGLSPIDATSTIGTLAFDAGSGELTATITGATSRFPTGATMRTVGLQGYLQQDLDSDSATEDDVVSLHTPSKVITVDGDDERREIVDSAKCANCHEWFEGHGGNRVYTIAICTMCHVPNQSSTGRTIVTPSQGLLDDFAEHGPIPGLDPNDPLTYPEDAQNLKDLVHGIHSSALRTRDYIHVRGGSHSGFYNWSEVTFPRGASTAHCGLCHMEEDPELPIDENALPTTVRTTTVDNGDDPDNATVVGAFQTLPNDTDWVNTKTASACGGCHTWDEAVNHMRQSGGFLNSSAFAAD